MCKNAISLNLENPIINDKTLIIKIKIIHKIIHNSNLKLGKTFISVTIMKNASATLSNIAPNLLHNLNFLAIYPSKTSLNPQIKYSMKNILENGFVNINKLVPIILINVMKLGINLLPTFFKT